jgi:hypothetical protein
MKAHIRIFYAYLIIALASCSKEFSSPSNSNQEVFEELLQFAEENYALFEVKKIDWTEVKKIYSPQVSNLMSQDDFYLICRDVINELRDGNSNVRKNLIPTYYNFIGSYDIQFKQEVVSNYLKQESRFGFGVRAGAINESIAYAYFSFNSLNSGEWLVAMDYLASAQYKKIIIDLRSAYGGEPQQGFNFLGHFVTAKTQIGTVFHKNGKGTQDLKKIPIEIQSASPLLNSKKIIILTNRKTFGVATYVAAVMNSLPNVTIIGQFSGPGSGIGFPYELPNGWVVTVSSNYFLPANGRHIEDGVKPDIEINNTAIDLQNKRDRMLERAIAE